MLRICGLAACIVGVLGVKAGIKLIGLLNGVLLFSRDDCDFSCMVVYRWNQCSYVAT